MELSHAIRRRHMVRSFQDRPVDGDAIDRMLDAAIRAPSAGFSQGWGFLVLTESDDRRRFWELIGEEEWLAAPRATGMQQAAVIIVPMANKQAYLERYSEPDKAHAGMQAEEAWPAPFWDIDTAFATMNILLTATDEGLGALFAGIARGQAGLLAHFGVPAEYRPIGFIAVGHPADDDVKSPSLERGRKGVDQVVHHGRWRD